MAAAIFPHMLQSCTSHIGVVTLLKIGNYVTAQTIRIFQKHKIDVSEVGCHYLYFWNSCYCFEVTSTWMKLNSASDQNTYGTHGIHPYIVIFLEYISSFPSTTLQFWVLHDRKIFSLKALDDNLAQFKEWHNRLFIIQLQT